MKKFLTKKPVMNAFVAAAVVFLAVYIGILVRPVSYGFNYTQIISSETGGKQTEKTTKFSIKSDKVVRITYIHKVNGKVKLEEFGEYWIYRDGNKILLIEMKEVFTTSNMTKEEIEEYYKEKCMSEEVYNERVKELKKMKSETPELYEMEMKEAIEFRLFSAGEDNPETKDIDESFTNVQAILFTVIHGVVTLALISFAGLAVYFTIKEKRA